MILLFPEREVFVHLFGWDVRWYGVLYVLAFWLAWWVLPRIQKYRGLSLSRDEWSYVLMWGVVGVLVGGRLGYVLFYEPGFFLANPIEIVRLWHGGMSSHGGFMGAGFGVWLAARRLGADAWRLFDVLVVPVALGLALGRLGNWINQELYPGNLALVAVGKDLLIAGVCFLLLARTPSRFPPDRVQSGILVRGRITALFLILYAVLRWLTEYIRIQEWPTSVGVTRGQLLTVPVLLIGIWLWQKSKKLAKNSD